MTARTLGYRGHVVEPGWLTKTATQQLRELADQFPVGARVTHACGRGGTVALDQPAHVPGLGSGQPTTVCLGGPWHNEPMVFATWDNEADLIWRVWVPVAKLRRGHALVVNRPGNKARKGGRR
ncbi:hypothetical protein RI578_06785 [Streptomyces sp. BB1-1-1]|uniref:hypothetical protein n=1 Tax=Streptomyces sp. BB1-1-1 TaxID=3074430 RepID=UPI002877805A|nr:hypothetical protein [Streptomyces sp. BB1-1-1]WND34019.1 hypothetical protein RI578_06785 [Streptomyces sp. BB1-1-1]